MTKNVLIVCDANSGGIFNYAKPLYERLKKYIKIDFYYRNNGLINRIIYYLNLIRKLNGKKYHLIDIQSLSWPIMLLIILIWKVNKSFKTIFESHDDPLTARTKYRPMFIREFILKNSDLIIAHSRYNERIIKNLGFKNVFYVPLGSYIEITKNIYRNKTKSVIKINSNKKILLFFGIITPDKGLDVLLKALKIVSEKEKNILLLIIGPVKKEWVKWEYYENLIKTLNIEKFVKKKLEYINLEELIPYIYASDVVIMPHKEITNSSIPFVSYEFKKPIIATNVGGTKEIVINNKTGLLVEKENEKELAKKILKIINNKEKLRIFGNNGYKLLKTKYSWKEISKKYLYILRR